MHATRSEFRRYITWYISGVGRGLLDWIGLGTGPDTDPYLAKTNGACLNGDLAECFKSRALGSLDEFFDKVCFYADGIFENESFAMLFANSPIFFFSLYTNSLKLRGLLGCLRSNFVKSLRSRTSIRKHQDRMNRNGTNCLSSSWERYLINNNIENTNIQEYKLVL